MLHLAPNLVNFSGKMSIEELNLTWPLLFWSYQADDSQAAEDDEPEPEEDVDLLVDDVDGENADCVVGLNCSRGTVLQAWPSVTKMLVLGREPWFSGNGRKLMLWVVGLIPSTIGWMDFLTLFFVKIVMFVWKRPKINKRGHFWNNILD